VQGDATLFSEMQTTEFRSRWSSIQTGFVDELRKTMAEADRLVALLMTQLAEGFANERTQSSRGGPPTQRGLKETELAALSAEARISTSRVEREAA